MSPQKVLFLVRHAKSSWKDPTLTDRDRPLNKRGLRDAPRMGKRLAKRPLGPELIVSSPAVRALATAEAIAEELGSVPSEVRVEEQVYGSDTTGLIEVIRHLNNRFDRVMMVGHNPALTELINLLTESNIDNVPTCGVAVLTFGTDTWEDIGSVRAKLVAFDYSKKPG